MFAEQQDLPQLAHNGIMSIEPNSVVEIEVRYTNGIPHIRLGNLQTSRIRCREARFILFRPQEIDSMHCPVLLDQVQEVAFECWLGGLRSCDLNLLPEGLEPLLLPEYYN